MLSFASQFIIGFLLIVIAITIHEFSHALAARLLGDTTAERMGRLSLNPIVHLDPIGTLMIVVASLSGIGIGWGKPCPVSPWNLRPRGRVGMAIVSLAGPASNLLLAIALALVLRLLPHAVLLTPTGGVLYLAMTLNVGLTVFNLLPLPPLDGFHVLMGVLAVIRANWAYSLGNQLARIEPHGPMILLVLVMLGAVMRGGPSPLWLIMTPGYNLLAHLVGLIAGI